MKCNIYSKYCWLVFSSLLLFSCKKDVRTYLGIIDAGDTGFTGIFEEFWIKMNNNYVYWDIDTTNWDQIYRRYKPVFKNLDLLKTDDVKKSVAYFREMTAGLTDGHYYIAFQNSTIRDSIIYPSYDRKRKSTGFHNPYPYFSVVKNYLDADYVSGTNVISGQPALFVVSGAINKKALYFSCSNFSLFQAYHAGNGNTAGNVIQYFFNVLNNVPSTIHGVIIDLRDNRGGNLSDLNFLAGQLVETPLHFGYTSYKSGNGRLEYTPWFSSYINPSATGKTLNIPVMVLVDNFTASLSELVTLAIAQLPNSVVIGERTWGATGPITLYEIYNDGQFKVGSFMSVQTSSARFTAVDHAIYEGVGVLPSVQVAFDKAMLDAGKDIVLEKAISLIP